MTDARWRAVAGALAAVLALSLGWLAYVLATGEDSGPGDEALALAEAEEGALEAARDAAVRLTSYSHTSLDTDFAWARTAGTASFQAEYAKVTPPVADYVERLEVTAKGTVDDAAATAEDEDHVTVLLFVDQTLVSGTTGERTLVTPRITMKMVRTGGAWMLDDASLRNLAGG